MGLFSRNLPTEPDDTEPVEHAWSLDRIVEEKRSDAADANPAIALRIHPDVPTTTEAAANPIDAVMVGCGTCTAEVPRSEWGGHKCALTPRQAARNRRAMQAMAKAATFPTITTICDMCGTEFSAGVHRCTGPKALLPVDAAALAFQQAGARQALQEMVDLANKGGNGGAA
jgi:hypothetical protein